MAKTTPRKYPEEFTTHTAYLEHLDGFAVMGVADSDWVFNGEYSYEVERFTPQPQEYFIEILRLARIGIEAEARQYHVSGVE